MDIFNPRDLKDLENVDKAIKLLTVASLPPRWENEGLKRLTKSELCQDILSLFKVVILLRALTQSPPEITPNIRGTFKLIIDNHLIEFGVSDEQINRLKSLY